MLDNGPEQGLDLEAYHTSIKPPTGRGSERLWSRILTIISLPALSLVGGRGGLKAGEALYYSPPEAVSSLLPHLFKPGNEALPASGFIAGFLAGMVTWISLLDLGELIDRKLRR